ncbi:MAG: DUF4249 domain-containing protein [Saprospiraceae bacterium]|nr:DUF4249 domain-containing protein [Lewinella sp.]
MLLTILSQAACVEIIEFDTTREGGQLVVDGGVGTGSGPFDVYLGRTASTNRITTPVEQAEIAVYDDLGTVLAYQEIGEGHYQIAEGLLRPEIGRTYHIRIRLPNGNMYESEPETIPPVPARLDSIYFDFEKQEELNEYGNIITYPVVNAYVDLRVEQNADVQSFYRFDVEEVYLLSPTDFPDPFGVIPPPCFVYDYPATRDFLLTDVKGEQIRTLRGLKVATQILDWRFEEKHYFNVYLQSLTENAYTFWRQVNQTITNVGTIFDTPPAPIRGNVYNLNDPGEEVLGYFSAASRDTIRRALTPGETPARPLYECKYSPFEFDYPERCLDCLSVPGSTYQRPEYF